MDEAKILAKVPIFFFLRKEDLQRIAKLTKLHEFREGDVIVREGDRDHRMFIVVSGEVQVVKNLGRKNKTPLATFGPFSYFGEMALIDEMVRSASVVAKSDVCVISLDQWNLRQEIERYPMIAIELLQTMSRRVRALETTMVHTIGAFLPICANCKKIREDDSWIAIEAYIRNHSEAEFTHSICPECSQKLYPGYA